jgi:hypothetical protein
MGFIKLQKRYVLGSMNVKGDAAKGHIACDDCDVFMFGFKNRVDHIVISAIGFDVRYVKVVH